MKLIARLIIVAGLLSGSTSFLFAGKVDSLEALIRTSPKDTHTVTLYLDLGKLLILSDPKAGFDAGYSGLSLALKLKYPEGEGNMCNLLGVLHYYKGNFDSSEYYYKRTIAVGEKYGLTKIRTKALANLGSVYNKMGKYDLATEALVEALRFNEASGDSVSIARNLADIANSYFLLDKHMESAKYNERALEIFRKNGNRYGEANVLNSLGLSYKALGDTVVAVKYFYESIRVRELSGDKKGLANTLHNLGQLMRDLKMPDSALYFLSRSLEINSEFGNKEGIANNTLGLGLIYSELGHHRKALDYFMRSYELSDSIGSLIIKSTSAQDIADEYRILGDYKSAFLYYKIYKRTSDSLKNLQIEEKISEIQTKYETEKKEKTIAEQEREIEEQRIRSRNILLVSSLFIALILVVTVLLISRYRLKQRSRLAAEIFKQQKIQFRAVIEAEEKERARVARELHDGLGQLLSSVKMNVSTLDEAVNNSDEGDRQVFRTSLNIIDEAVSEVRNISHNLMPGALVKIGLRAALGDMCHNVNTAGTIKADLQTNLNDDRLNESVEIAVYRIVQEVMSNVMRHSEANTVSIDLNRKGDEILLTVSDNGKGMNPASISESKGIGWKNIASRVSLFNGTLDVHSEKGKGTAVMVKLSIA